VTETTYKSPGEQNHIMEDPPVGKFIGDISHSENTVYLTFDDGPGQYTKQLVSILDQNRLKGSFFWIGNNLRHWVEEDPSNVAFARYMVKEGDVIGSHTMKHLPLSHKSLEEQEQMIEESTNFVSQTIGSPVYYFRPPYGAVDQNTKKASIDTGQVLAYWEVDSEDWRYPNHPEKVIANIEKEVKPGAIILMHEKSNTVHLLQQAIHLLKNKGYQISALPTPKRGF
jgi:peptidoglycan-N-acetylglucosamine deacetylase